MIPLHSGIPQGIQFELGTFFLIGLLGGAHCLGMCGPIVTMYARQLDKTGGSGSGTASGSGRAVLTTYEVRQHALFNFGRTVSYAVLGGLFGLLGALFFETATVVRVGESVRSIVGIFVGLAIIGTGSHYLLGRRGSRLATFPGIAGITGIFQRLQSRLHDWVQGPGIVGLGLVHGLLPCPILYPVYLYAFARGSPAVGVLALGVLGLGTFPTLFLYGTVVQSVDTVHRQRLHRVLGVAFLVLGLMPVAHGLDTLGIHVPHVELPIYQPFGS